jgi:hypothetical protein
MGLVCLESHDKVDLLLELDNFKDIVDNCSRNVDFLNNKLGKTFVVLSTMNSLSKHPYVFFFIDWKNILSSLLCMKITFKAIACIYDRKSFNNLVVTLHENDFKDDISMVYKFYQASKKEIPFVRSLGSWMNLPILIYTFRCPS